jgi:signal transduction histidine kinase/CheY-like chemotaxis protein
MLTGFFVLIGWQFDITILKTFALSTDTMKPNTAACFLFAGLALFFLQRSYYFANSIVRFLALVIILMGILSLFQNLFGWDIGIDEILFREPKGTIGTSHFGLMAPSTALNFLLLGFAFFLLTFQRFKSSLLVEFSLVFPLAMSILWLIGYLTRLAEIAGFFAYIKMSVYTTCTFIILSVGMLLTGTERQRFSITIEQKVFAGLTIVTSIVIFITQLSFSGINSLLGASEWVEHTQQVKNQLTEVLSQVIDVETGARGFVIIGEESYAEPLNKALVEIPNVLKNLRLQISDNPRQQESLALLEHLINERIEVAKRLYQTRRSQGLERAISLFATGKEKIITDSIRVLIIQMIAEENRLMQVRNSNEKYQTNQTQIIIYFSLAIQMLLLVFIFVFVNRDVAGRRKAEEEIRNLNVDLEMRIKERTARLAQINEDLHKEIKERHRSQVETQKAKAEAERANVAKSEFLSRMSHELRTPMNSILGFAQLIDMGELNPTHKKGVDQILKSGKHLLNLINEVLDISWIETGRLTISTEPVELCSIIMETIEIVSNLAKENQITLESDASTTERLFVKADHQRLKQVLLNLINNAIKYNRKGGSVKIESRIQNSDLRMEQPANIIRISITDTGKGITKEDIEKLFNPFERIGAERTEIEGTGLGLAISKKLIEAMGGKIGVESQVCDLPAGKAGGSTFWIELPQTESQKKHYERMGELTKPEAEIKQNSGIILYIEDNLSNIQLVEQILETHRPLINLITNIYGKNAVQFAIDYKPDLILLDLNLPDIHGNEVLKMLQAEPRTAEIPVIILSADAMVKQSEQLMEAGAKDYLIKPIDVMQFLKVVDEWMRKSSIE